VVHTDEKHRTVDLRWCSFFGVVGFKFWRITSRIRDWQHLKLGKDPGSNNDEPTNWWLFKCGSYKSKTANRLCNNANESNGELALMSQGKKVVIDMSESIKNGSGRDMEQWVLRLAVLYILFGESAVGLI
jgi:hypothetical protein